MAASELNLSTVFQIQFRILADPRLVLVGFLICVEMSGPMTLPT